MILQSIALTPAAFAAECNPEVSQNGSLTIVIFKIPGSCSWNTPVASTLFRGLVIGGGGGGGAQLGGGGGGGGLIEFDSLPISNEELTITVGAGGTGSTLRTSPGTSGDNSSISSTTISLVARGGAGAKSDSSSTSPGARANGGSGGGGSGNFNGASLGSQTSQNQTPSLSSISGSQYGFDGGGTATKKAGGGGGSSASGSILTGGAGRSNNILGSNFTWAGGGGGASDGPYIAGAGGSGGGGGGGFQNSVGGAGSAGTGGISAATAGASVGGNGAPNTGGGGGGGAINFGGGNGGSGIVILSYLRTTSSPGVSFQLSTGGRLATYRTPVYLDAYVPVNGKVTFFQGGRVIAGCRNRTTSGTSPNIKARCLWSPSVRGSANLTAIFRPFNINYSTVVTPPYPIFVSNRSIKR
jgi:hypothetical protein